MSWTLRTSAATSRTSLNSGEAPSCCFARCPSAENATGHAESHRQEFAQDEQEGPLALPELPGLALAIPSRRGRV
eukprot:5134621-Amphidinium_carterae.1